MTILQMQKGFTLIELMVTLAVLAILLSLGVPSFTTWVQDSRLDTTAQNISAALKLARSEAVARQTVISLDWGINADNEVEADIFVDTDLDGFLDNGETIIKQGMSFSSSGIIPVSSNNSTFVSFSADGTYSNGDILIAVCDSRQLLADSWDIAINPVGRISLSQPSADCSP